jgi:hypothetical protein
MNQEEVESFEKIESQMRSVYGEISNLSKKNPNDGLNKFKLNIINKLLIGANSILGDEYKPTDDFSAFDIDEVPTNSDVVFVCAQYLSCLEKLRSDNIYHSLGEWYWVIDHERSHRETRPPERIGR